jgi:hypothetical protein
MNVIMVDGASYFEATGLCRQYGVTIHDFLRLPRVKRLVKQLEGKWQFPMRIQQGRATFLSEKISKRFCSWLAPAEEVRICSARCLEQRLSIVEEAAAPRKNKMRQVIYILESGGYVKIGKTRDLEYRVKQLQVGNPIEIRVLCAAEVPDAASVEREVLDAARMCHERGEWHFVTVGELADLIDLIKTNTEN